MSHPASHTVERTAGRTAERSAVADLRPPAPRRSSIGEAPAEAVGTEAHDSPPPDEPACAIIDAAVPERGTE